MTFNQKLKDNIKKNYIFTLLQNMDLTRGIWMIYLASKGMSLTQLGLLETIFHITSFTMEVPTGAVADVYGRKTSRILGRLLSIISVLLLLYSNNFLWFAISFVFTALSYNLESGAGDALIYDSLKEIGDESKFMKINGNKEMFYQTASIVSFFAGGYLATQSYPLAFYLTIALGVITMIYAFSFTEPTIGKVVSNQTQKNIFLSQLKVSLSVIKKQPRISFLIVFSQLIMAFCTCIFYYLQNYMKADGYNEAMIGFIYAFAALSMAIVAPQVHRIERFIKEQGILTIIPLVTVLSIWGIALSKYHYVFFIVMMLTEGIIYITLSDYINKMIPSENRATILSIASMVFSFFMITLFPIIGMIGDRYSLQISFMSLAALGSVLVIINSVVFKLRNQQ